jgi:hypothetical protein
MSSNENPSNPGSPDEPKTDSGEKESIRKSQEEFIDDMAQPSMDKSEYEKLKGKDDAQKDA